MENLSSLIEKVRQVKHFRNLSMSDLTAIVSSGQIRRFTPSSTIFVENEPCAGMFVLIKGRVHLCKLGPQGQVHIMSVIEPVIMFNEVAVLDCGPNPVTAIAAEDCLVWQIQCEPFQALIERIPQVGLSLLRVLARRNREMIAHYEDLSFRTVLARTSKLLLDLSDNGHHPIDRRTCSIEEMASRIATVPEAISRSLNVIKGSAAILVNRTEIVIVSVEKLSVLAQVGQIYTESFNG
jgi:CRP-like cAMP-binding protein